MTDVKPNLFELLQLRFEFEEYNRHFKNMPPSGDYASLQRFIATGYARNRFRPNADRALELAKIIVANTPHTQAVE